VAADLHLSPGPVRTGGKKEKAESGDGRGGWLLAAPLLVFAAALFVIPAVSVVRTSLAPGDGLRGGVSLEHFERFFTDQLYLKAMVNTLVLALLAVLVSAVLGLVYAYLLTVRPGLRQLQLALLLAPLLVNGVVRIFGLQLGLDALNQLLVRIGIIDAPLPLQYSYAGIVIAFVMFQFPYMAMAVYASLSRLDPALAEAARTLGAGRTAVMVRVVLPMAVPGLAAGAVLTFAACAGSYIVPAMMGGGRVSTLPQMIFTQVTQVNHWGTASAFAMVLIVVLAVPILAASRRGAVSTAGGR
jgi:putative spermidine/putrescine transport system permease protein